MELDVHLERSNEELWGFDIAGNPEQNLPLTIIKISQDTPAEKAGLKCDDVVMKIGEKLVADLSHEEALQAIDDAKDALLLRVARGLYDPVVEDPEDPFEKYEQPDSDQQSEPTEVLFKIEQFIEPPGLDPSLDSTPLGPSPLGSSPLGPTPFVPTPLGPEFSESRSLTASPYGQKQYRPFSTEPLPDIPPLEDPLLLNPNYQDTFPKPSEEQVENIPVETKFKLPLSEKYDPEGKKQKVEKKDDIIERKVIKEVSDDILKYIAENEKKQREMLKKKQSKKMLKKATEEVKKTEENKKENILQIAKEEKAKLEAKKFMEEVLQEIEIKKMEEAALNVVEESIQTAVSITEEIKKETIKEEIIKTSKLEETIEKEKTSKKVIEEKYTKDSKDVVEIIDKKIDVLAKDISPEASFVEEEVHQIYEKKTREEKIYPNILEDIQEEKEESMAEESNVVREIKKEEISKIEEIVELNKDEKEANVKKEIVKKEEIIQEKDVVQSNVQETNYEQKEEKGSDEILKHTALTSETVAESKPGVNIVKEEIKFEHYEEHTKVEKYGDSGENTKEVKDPSLIETSEQVIKPEVSVVEEERKFESYKEEIKEEKYANYVEEIEKEKETITRKSSDTKPEINYEETEEVEITKKQTEEEKKSDSKDQPIIVNQSAQPDYFVKKGQKFESYGEEKDKIEKISGATKKVKESTTTDNSKMGREEKEQIKQTVVLQKHELIGADKMPPKVIESLEKKEYETMNTRKESVIYDKKIDNQPVLAENPIEEPKISKLHGKREENVYHKSKETQEKVYTEKKVPGDFKSEAERRVYTLGLQTIPNIRGVVHSYHLNLLLKTFFIHLTDVMVALSRFILTQPVFSIEDKEAVKKSMMEKTVRVEQERHDREVIEDRIQKEVDRRVEQKLQEEAYEREEMKRAEMRVAEERQKKQIEQKRQQEMQRMKEVVKEEMTEEKKMESAYKEENTYLGVKETKKPSGAKMAQLTEKKTEELAQKMKSVINEFQQKSATEEIKQRRSSSRSLVEEEIMKQGDPLEWLAKVDSRGASQERQVTSTTRHAGYQSTESKRSEARQETRSIRTIKPGRQTYRAIVEAHVYTNPDVIFEDHSGEMTDLEIQELEMRESLEIRRREEERLEMIRREEERKEMQRREQQRIEMQRQEQRRLEIQRQEQQRLERIRIERERMDMKRREEQRLEILRREERMLEMRRREELARSFEKQHYSRNKILHEAVQKVEDFIETKRLLEQAMMMQQSTRSVVKQMQQVIEPPPQIYKATVAQKQRAVAVKQKEFIKTAAQRTETIDTSIHKTFDAKKYIQRVAKPRLMEEKAVQVTQIAAKEQASDLKLNKREAVKVIKSLVDQKAALEVLQVHSVKDEVREFKVKKQQKYDASRSIIEQRGAVQVTKVQSAKDEVSELKITKQEAKEVIKSLVEQKAALEVLEVQSTRDELSALQIKKQQTVDASRSIIEQRGAIEVASVEATKDEVAELKITKQKAVDVSKTIIEQTPALQVVEVESTKDEVAELKVMKEKAIDVSQKIIEQTAAIQVAEVESTKDEIKELQISKAKSVDVSQSIIEQKALQVSEVKTTTDEITELETSKKKAVDVSETLIEHTGALQVAEVETSKDEVADLEITKEKAVDASKTIIEQTAALQIAEVETTKDEIAELEIITQKAVDVSQSIIEQTAALQVAKVESTKDEISELQIDKQKAVDASETIIEQSAALQVMKVETEIDELSQLRIEEAKSVDVQASMEMARSTAAVVSEVETVEGDVSELKVKVQEQAEIAKTSEVIEEKDKAKAFKVPTILDEFAELKIVKYDVQEADDTGEISDERVSAVEITEIESEHKEMNEMSMSEQKVHIEQSLEVEEKRAESHVSQVSAQASKDEFAALKIIKHQELEVEQSHEMEVEVSEEKSFMSQEIHQQSSMVQEASFIAKSAQITEEVKMVTDTTSEKSEKSEPSTPSTHPPTPLTDEYVFRLDIPLPKSRGTTPIPPEPPRVVKKEDPHIVKKNLVPHIEATIEPPIVYDPPLPTPPTSPDSKPSSPKYVKPGLRGGAQYPQIRREEIQEMKRKSSLLASAIDETIKSIEEYKEEVGIETKKHVKEEIHITKTTTVEKTVVENGDAKEIEIDTKEEVMEKTESNTNKDTEDKVEEITNSMDNGETKKEESKVEETKVEEKSIEEVSKVEIIENGIEEKKEVEVIQETNDKIEGVSKPIKAVPESVEITEVKEEIVKEVIEIKEEKSEKKEIKTEDTSVSVEKTETTEVKSLPEEPVKTDSVEEVAKDEEDKEVEKIAKELEQTKKQAEEVTKEIKTEITEQKIENKTESVEVAKEFKKTEAKEEEKIDYLKLVKPVKFDPEAAQSQRSTPVPPVQEPTEPSDGRDSKMYVDESGEPLGTIQGIVDGLEEAIVDEEVAKALGKPGMPQEKIAELVSGEADMLREAHVMGLSRVLTSHMHRVDDVTEEIKPIKPLVPTLEHSEVLKALNEEILLEEEKRKKKEEKRWTTFLQKPKRPVPRAKFGYYAYLEAEEEELKEPYKVKIVKQPKPKVAPDYKPEDFDTGPLPWEQRAEVEASLPPIEPEDPILIPEEGPEFLEAVDPLPESAVPDLEDTGIPLPVFEPPPPAPEIILPEEVIEEAAVPEPVEPTRVEEVKEAVEMDENKLAEQLTRSVQSMVDPNAPLEQQLAQMRAQLAALAQLPGVIQQTLDLVTRQLLQFSHQGVQQMQTQMAENHTETQQTYETYEETQTQQHIENYQQQIEQTHVEIEQIQENGVPEQNQQTVQQEIQPSEKILSPEEMEALRREEEARLEEQRKSEKQMKELMQQYEDDTRRSQQPTPRPCKPKPKFGPLDPEERRLVATGRPVRFRKDVYDEKLIAETIQAQSELIQGKVLGLSSERDFRPYERINFMKYEKPPPSLDHLKNSEVYKVVHNMDERPLKRVELLTPVIAESDYRKRCRSRTPSRLEERLQSSFPQQLQP